MLSILFAPSFPITGFAFPSDDEEYSDLLHPLLNVGVESLGRPRGSPFESRGEEGAARGSARD